MVTLEAPFPSTCDGLGSAPAKMRRVLNSMNGLIDEACLAANMKLRPVRIFRGQLRQFG